MPTPVDTAFVVEDRLRRDALACVSDCPRIEGLASARPSSLDGVALELRRGGPLDRLREFLTERLAEFARSAAGRVADLLPGESIDAKVDAIVDAAETAFEAVWPAGLLYTAIKPHVWAPIERLIRTIARPIVERISGVEASDSFELTLSAVECDEDDCPHETEDCDDVEECEAEKPKRARPGPRATPRFSRTRG